MMWSVTPAGPNARRRVGDSQDVTDSNNMLLSYELWGIRSSLRLPGVNRLFCKKINKKGGLNPVCLSSTDGTLYNDDMCLFDSSWWIHCQDMTPLWPLVFMTNACHHLSSPINTALKCLGGTQRTWKTVKYWTMWTRGHMYIFYSNGHYLLALNTCNVLWLVVFCHIRW